MTPQLKKCLKKLEENNLDALIVSSAPNISYLTDTVSRDSCLLISKKKNIYITDGRYREEAKSNLNSIFTIRASDSSLFKIITDACLKLKLKRIGFEEKSLVFSEYKKLKSSLPKPITLISANNIVEELRQIKTPEELKKIKKALAITIGALKFIKGFLSAGKKELEIAAELERFIRYNGADRSAFEIIVASGPNSSFPHHITSQRKLENRQPVLIDIGVSVLGYKSDLTRVFFLGKMNALQKRIYDLVLKAQDHAIRLIKPDVNIREVDAAARQLITKQGYGGFFTHALGHGVGLEVHEAPRISNKEKGILKPGMVFTLEPAIYLPHKFGVRLEDMVLVTRKGVEVLSGALDK